MRARATAPASGEQCLLLALRQTGAVSAPLVASWDERTTAVDSMRGARRAFPEGLSQNLRRRSQEQTCHYRGDQQVRPFRRRAPDCQSSDHNRDIPNGIIP